MFNFGHRCFWRHDISHSDHSQHCFNGVSAKHSVCLHVSIVWHWTLIGQCRINFSPVGFIWLNFIRLCESRAIFHVNCSVENCFSTKLTCIHAVSNFTEIGIYWNKKRARKMTQIISRRLKAFPRVPKIKFRFRLVPKACRVSLCTKLTMRVASQPRGLNLPKTWERRD